MSLPAVKAALRVTHELHGVVVSAGLMEKTVKVRVGGQKWNNIVKKTFAKPKHYLVHDPMSSLRTGDVVSIAPGWRTSQRKRHIVKQIIAPYGTPVEERPAVPSLNEILGEYEQKKAAKHERWATRKGEETENIAEEKRIKLEEQEAKHQAREKMQQRRQRQRQQQQQSSNEVD